jgi:hypothetical protein
LFVLFFYKLMSCFFQTPPKNSLNFSPPPVRQLFFSPSLNFFSQTYQNILKSPFLLK